MSPAPLALLLADGLGRDEAVARLLGSADSSTGCGPGCRGRLDVAAALGVSRSTESPTSSLAPVSTTRPVVAPRIVAKPLARPATPAVPRPRPTAPTTDALTGDRTVADAPDATTSVIGDDPVDGSVVGDTSPGSDLTFELALAPGNVPHLARSSSVTSPPFVLALLGLVAIVGGTVVQRRARRSLA